MISTRHLCPAAGGLAGGEARPGPRAAMDAEGELLRLCINLLAAHMALQQQGGPGAGGGPGGGTGGG